MPGVKEGVGCKGSERAAQGVPEASAAGPALSPAQPSPLTARMDCVTFSGVIQAKTTSGIEQSVCDLELPTQGARLYLELGTQTLSHVLVK